jgi:hypothetical protein
MHIHIHQMMYMQAHMQMLHATAMQQPCVRADEMPAGRGSSLEEPSFDRGREAAPREAAPRQRQVPVDLPLQCHARPQCHAPQCHGAGRGGGMEHPQPKCVERDGVGVTLEQAHHTIGRLLLHTSACRRESCFEATQSMLGQRRRGQRTPRRGRAEVGACPAA